MQDRSDEVFHLDGEKLIPMPSRSMREGLLGKTLEDALQTFFENYPQIIPGKQIDPGSDDPPHFVLLRREMPVGSWSLDHLFVDQKGILTLVETKLFQNPESRREVIGQIVEYAANSIESWSAGIARQKAIEFWSTRNRDLESVLQDEFGGELDIEDFWRTIEGNLKSGKIRLIIASDELRPEVRRMIEYLNKELQNAEVLGLELKSYGEGNSFVLVPRLIGQTQSIIDTKGPSEGIFKWTVDKLKAAYTDFKDNDFGQRLEKILNWALKKDFFKMSISRKPNFGLQGNNKGRMATFFSNGDIYVTINEKHYRNGSTERDKLVAELKGLQLLDQGLVPQEVLDGRNLTKKLFELSEEELDKLLSIFGTYCS